MKAKRYGAVRNRYGQNGTGPVRAKQYGTGTGKTVWDRYMQNGTGPVRAKRYRTGTGKTIRDRYGQIGTGPARAKQSVRELQGQNGTGPYGLRCGRCTGHGVGAVRGPHLSPCAARTGNVQGPFGCPYGLLLGLPRPCPYGHVYWNSSYSLFLPVLCSSHESPTGQLSTHTIFRIRRNGI